MYIVIFAEQGSYVNKETVSDGTMNILWNYVGLWCFTPLSTIFQFYRGDVDFGKISFYIQSNLSYVTFRGNIEIGSHKTGGC